MLCKSTYREKRQNKAWYNWVGKIANEINEALITLLPDGGKSNTVAFTALNMPWPLPEQSLSDMLSIAEEVLVIEEKRSFVEDQIAKICVKKGRNMLLSGKRAQMEKIYYHLMAKYHLRTL